MIIKFTKNASFSRKVFLFFTLLLIASNSFGQSFWMDLNPPGNSEILVVKGNALGDIFLNANGIYKSTDSAINWTEAGFQETGSNAMDINKQSGYIYVNSGTNIYYSSDNGDTWVNTAFQLQPDYAITFIFSSENNHLFVGTTNGIFKSEDNGNSWTHVLVDNTNTKKVTAIIEPVNGTLFASIDGESGGGGVFRSTDKGDNWTFVGFNDDHVSSLAFSSNGVLFAGSTGNYSTSAKGIYKSTDMGDTWEVINPNMRAMSIVVDKNNTIYATEKLFVDGIPGVRRSTNGGVSWNSFVSGMCDTHVEKLSLSPDGFIFAFYNKLYRSVKQIVTGIANTNAIPLQVWPNPVIDELHIDGISANTATISVSDALGREVHRQKYTGEPMNLSRLSAGVYLLRVEADGQPAVHKIVKK